MNMLKANKATSRSSGESEKSNTSSSLQEAKEGAEEFVSLVMLNRMLSVQESMNRAFFDSVLSSIMTSTRVDDLGRW